jgi:hypothetical protein
MPYKRLTEEDKRNYARSQLNFLKEKGIADPLRLSRIFKAAGPAQIQEAWRIATQTQDPVKKDLLDCLLMGAGGAQEFSRERMEAVFKLAGLECPKANSEFAFFRVIDGAMEILVPGSYDFTPEEIKELESRAAAAAAKNGKPVEPPPVEAAKTEDGSPGIRTQPV